MFIVSREPSRASFRTYGFAGQALWNSPQSAAGSAKVFSFKTGVCVPSCTFMKAVTETCKFSNVESTWIRNLKKNVHNFEKSSDVLEVN